MDCFSCFFAVPVFTDYPAGGSSRSIPLAVVSQFDQGRSLIHVSDVTKPDEQQDSARQY